MATKTSQTWYRCALKTPTPGLRSNTLTLATRSCVVPKLTASVMVMLPATNAHPHIHDASLRHADGETMNVWW